MSQFNKSVAAKSDIGNMGKHKQQLRQMESLFVPRKNSIEIKSIDPNDCNIHGGRRESNSPIAGLHSKRDSVSASINGGLGKRDSVDGDRDTNGENIAYRSRASVDRDTGPATGDTYAWLMRRRSSGSRANDGNR